MRYKPLPTITSSLLLTLIIRILHALVEAIHILLSIIIPILNPLVKTIHILLSIIISVLNILLGASAFILRTANLFANPVCSTAQTGADV
jgi:hypothetical protein